MIALESSGVESAGGSQLMIDVNNKSTAIKPRLPHEVKRKGARKGYETIVARFSHNQHVLDV